MVTRCLLVIKNDLMAAGVRSALALDNDVIVCSPTATTEAQIELAIKTMQLDAIIVDESLEPIKLSNLLRLFRHQAHLQIILINPEDNSLYVYQRQRIEVSQVSDLSSIVRHQHPNGNGNFT